jgi:hypothetical protein
MKYRVEYTAIATQDNSVNHHNTVLGHLADGAVVERTGSDFPLSPDMVELCSDMLHRCMVAQNNSLKASRI